MRSELHFEYKTTLVIMKVKWLLDAKYNIFMASLGTTQRAGLVVGKPS